MDTRAILFIVAAVLSVIAAILSMILIVPEKRLHKMGGFIKFLHDTFNFKRLLIEGIFKFLYITTTLMMVLFGLFTVGAGIFSDVTTVVVGLGLMLLGPIAARLVYELMMLFILLTKNTIDMNKRQAEAEARRLRKLKRREEQERYDEAE